GFESHSLRMWYIYVIQSINYSFRYTGMSENPSIRLKSHNAGKVKSTKAFKPFKIIYKEVCKDRLCARKREKYLKSTSGRRFIDKKLHKEGFLPDG
ncbi:MAG: GIY-YIG nuclease family protein, partial [Candidatus Marinimicrobia bacterium]|nr:GIY-YIG nuclease family protein [Candidatus Neomarinimicrobiota bacterium]MBT3495846.1 GIY-YIG nuclease family protein [Candidatus Neomarinimicrobiota bacterium]MBT3731628.1 GIY-YIG nuclease family protein [Candidatus Neomarinimicrobiota bacterium]MBT4145111.1 GIY-YIG nuclease family protein [Candidatus Neomarinimicrobiota bacterium]MBT4176679.1 GIY-YIG nuclease family protein [Candidatus Neomarinimicrobiota bacterium]